MSNTKLTNGGVVQLNELIVMLFKSCKGQAKGVFSSLLSHLTLHEVTYCHIKQPSTDSQPLLQDMQLKA